MGYETVLGWFDPATSLISHPPSLFFFMALGFLSLLSELQAH